MLTPECSHAQGHAYPPNCPNDVRDRTSSLSTEQSGTGDQEERRTWWHLGVKRLTHVLHAAWEGRGQVDEDTLAADAGMSSGPSVHC
jgi:hypothetical protein